VPRRRTPPAGAGRAITIGERELYASASIGIVLGGPQDHTVDDVLRDADIAMYRAKGSGRGGAINCSIP
jgi:GGDEF domain-containing protein